MWFCVSTRPDSLGLVDVILCTYTKEVLIVTDVTLKHNNIVVHPFLTLEELTISQLTAATYCQQGE